MNTMKKPVGKDGQETKNRSGFSKNLCYEYICQRAVKQALCPAHTVKRALWRGYSVLLIVPSERAE